MTRLPMTEDLHLLLACNITQPLSPGRTGGQVIDFPDADGPLEFAYDEEWLAVLRGTHSLLSLRPTPVALPGAQGPHSQNTRIPPG